MRIDCTTCPARGRRCEGCVLTALWQLPELLGHHLPEVGSDVQAGGSAGAALAGAGMPLDAAERRAVAALVAAGLFDRDRVETLRAHPERPLRRAARPA